MLVVNDVFIVHWEEEEAQAPLPRGQPASSFHSRNIISKNDVRNAACCKFI